ncbi:acyltransferase family protein [Priestia megaterium]|uniref:acyltransferase family protein n=1 Tax=Priestia megaterium TaxID=1404 RepID=UPI0011A9A1CD|nr:acyltransferase family protein [Priestia megaterium]
MQQYNKWIDRLKGIGIITVVLGHTGNEFTHHYFFWFHMPLFFIISGYLFAPTLEFKKLLNWSFKKVNRLMIPYIFFGLCILGIIIIQNQDWSIESLLYGGRKLGYYYGVFWFVTCLLVTQLTFALTTYMFRSQILIIFIMAVFYGLAHVRGISQLMLPWSINTVLIALPYYAIGYYSRNMVHILKKKLILSLGIVVFCVIVILEQMQKLNYELDLKAGVYNHLYLDIIIPISCIVLLYHLSNNLKYRWLEKITESIGMASMSIMFLHIPIYILGLKYTNNGFLLGIIGILISYSIHQLFKLSFITRFMFLGMTTKRNSLNLQGTDHTVADISK